MEINLAQVRPPLWIWKTLQEAWLRSADSFSRSMEEYHGRIELGLQPATPIVNFYDVYTQYNFVCWGNIVYLLITMALFTYMKKQPVGFRLRWVLATFDGLNVLAAGYVAYAIISYKLRRGGMLVCNSLNNDEDGHRLANAFSLFYIQKYFEFCDTWLFLLRKSFRQVTFLHLIYHSSITVVVGAIMPFDYNGDMFLPILLNCINHALIYLHYLLATLGIQSLWSHYITWFQLLQFVIIFAQSLVAYRLGPTCGSPDFAKVLMMVYMASMISLYGHYSLQRYVFGKPWVSMFGVVKRPNLVAELACSYCGSITLDDTGACTILLPIDFPDEEQLRKSTTSPIALLITYTLTPLGCAMPNLHISKEVGRHEIQQRTLFKKSLAAKLTAAGNAFQEGEQWPMRLLVSVGQKGEVVQRHDQERTYASLLSAWERNETSPERDRLRRGRNVVKASSFSDFQSVHNDRIIDGPHGLYQAEPLVAAQPSSAAETAAAAAMAAAAAAAAVAAPWAKDRRSKSNPALEGLDKALYADRPGDKLGDRLAHRVLGEGTSRSTAVLRERPSALPTNASHPTAAPSSSSRRQPGKSESTHPGTERPEVSSSGSSSSSSKPPPFSFEVSGGVKGARVSWSLRVIPQRRRRTQEESTVSSSFSSSDDRRFEDWRALS